MPAIADAGLGGTAPLALTGANSGERQRLFWRAVVLLIAALVVAPLIVLLTRIGGGVFSNGEDWIDSAIERAMGMVNDAGLDIVFVARESVSPGIQAIVDRYQR